MIQLPRLLIAENRHSKSFIAWLWKISLLIGIFQVFIAWRQHGSELRVLYFELRKLASNTCSIFVQSALEHNEHNTTTTTYLWVTEQGATTVYCMTMETLPLYIKKTLFCLTLVLYFTNLVSSQNYYVDPLDDTRSALLSYSSTPSKPGGICKTSIHLFSLAGF